MNTNRRFIRTRLPLGLAALAAVLVLAPAAFGKPGEKAGPGEKDEPRIVHRHRVTSTPQMLFFGGGGFLGVQLIDMTPELRRHMKAPEAAGVLVGSVTEGSPAEKAGLQVGDVLTSIGDEPVESRAGATREIARREQGDEVALAVWRDGSRLDFVATLDERTGGPVQPFNALRFVPKGEGWNWHFKGPDGEELNLEDLPDFDLKFIPKVDPEVWEKTFEGVGQYFASPEWQEQLEKLHQRRGGFQERIDELEQRLQELEKHLSEIGGSDG